MAIALMVLFSICLSETIIAQEDSLAVDPRVPDNEEHSVTGNILDELDTIVAKTNKIIIDEDTLPVYSFSVGTVGTTFPCGTRFGISLQAPGYHIFSAESAYNATYVPDSDEILWPDGGGEKQSLAYRKSFDRIRGLKVGEAEGSFGKRWTISSEQFKNNYSNMFDFELGGQQKLAGDYNNMFFDMLISIQQLANENDDLKAQLKDTEDRLTAIEAHLHMLDPALIRHNIANELKISPNPSNNGLLSVEYSINENVKSASLRVFDLDGKLHYQNSITHRGKGSFIESFNFASGVYFYQLVTDNDNGETVKLIIN